MVPGYGHVRGGVLQGTLRNAFDKVIAVPYYLE